MQLKEVEKEIVTEVTMPRVKSLYRYKGQGMGFEKGEVRYDNSWPGLGCNSTLHCDQWLSSPVGKSV